MFVNKLLHHIIRRRARSYSFSFAFFRSPFALLSILQLPIATTTAPAPAPATMKIKILSRSDAEWSGRNDGALNRARASTNINPMLHPPQQPLQVQRSITAAKLNRILARPFLFACAPSHTDGVYSLARSRTQVSLLASASADGELRLWHLPTHSPRLVVHSKPRAFIRDLSFSHDSNRILFCTDAKIVHCIPIEPDQVNHDPSIHSSQTLDAKSTSPAANLKTYHSTSGPVASIQAHYNDPLFATASSVVQLWHESRSAPIQTLSNSIESVHCVRWNPVETSILASSASDRSIVLYDIRAKLPIRSLVLKMRTNHISWNPIEAMNFVTANDDHNCYTYDMRKLSSAMAVHKDHTAAVMSVDFSPTGQEFVTGSYDKTIRIFSNTSGRSREVYHTKRMQRVFAVSFSLDGAYVISGSDDADVRVWKSERSRPLKPLHGAERDKIRAADKLIDRYQTLPEVRRIAKKRHLPAHVRSMQLTKSIIKKSKDRKEKNIRRNMKPEKRPKKITERQKNIIKELE